MKHPRIVASVIGLPVLLALAACGGGGGGSATPAFVPTAVFTANKDTATIFELYAADAAGNVRKLSGLMIATSNGVQDFTTSPDGRLVAYRAFQDSAQAEEVYVAPTDGSTAAVKVSGKLVAPGGNV